MSAASERRRVVYHGTVQGVGFRYTALRTAQRFSVGGYVRNLRDGTVELVAAGPTAPVREFLAAVAEAMSGCIERADEWPLDTAEDFSSFEIRH